MAWVTKLTVAVGVVVSGFALSACGTGSAVAQARAACVFVDHAIALEQRSQRLGLNPQQRAVLQQRALTAVLQAQPLAASATSTDGMWNPLQTTIEEANRVPLRLEIPALSRICHVANSASPYL